MKGAAPSALRVLLLAATAGCTPTTPTDADAGAVVTARSLPAACESYMSFYEQCLQRLPREEQQRRAPLFEVQKRSFHAVARNAVTDSARKSLERSCEEAQQQVRALCMQPR